MTRDAYIAVMMRYFQGVMDEDLGAIRAAFTPDARVTILHGDNPRREFHLVPRPGEESLEDFYGHIWRTFHVHFGQFTWVVDRDAQVCSAIFVPTLTPKPGSSQAAGGVNIYPREIEEVLLTHPAVSDVAVIGVPDEKWGERLRAFVVPRPGHSFTVDEMADHLQGQLASYKIPRELRLVDVLPRNANGKVLKTELRRMA